MSLIFHKKYAPFFQIQKIPSMVVLFFCILLKLKVSRILGQATINVDCVKNLIKLTHLQEANLISSVKKIQINKNKFPVP
jgi:hypothetical protein